MLESQIRSMSLYSLVEEAKLKQLVSGVGSEKRENLVEKLIDIHRFTEYQAQQVIDESIKKGVIVEKFEDSYILPKESDQ